MKKFVLGSVLSLLAIFSAGSAQESGPIEGRWLLDFDREDGSRLQLTLQRRTPGHGSSNNSSSFAVSAFRGLTRPAGQADAPAHFEIARDAGRILFEGLVNESGGSGRFQFMPAPDF